MSEWKETKLGDLIKIKSGFSYKGEFIGKGDSFLLGMGCVSFNKRFLNSGARKYSGTFSDSYTAKPGDIVLATRQQSDNLPILGLPAILPDEFKGKKVVVGTNLYRVENHSEISNDFLFWLLKSPEYQHHILSSAKGTTVKMITKDAVESFRFNCPPEEARNFISQTLSIIEDKIELNNKINQELESLAQLLFKRWFVDFDFPNENGEPYKSSGGEMIDSELGEIPKEWKVNFLTKELKVVYGKNLPTTLLEPNGYNVYGGNGIIGKYKTYLYEQQQVLIACRGAASGKVNISNKQSFVTNNSLVLEYSVGTKINFSYLKYWSFNQNFTNCVSGSAQPQITIENLSSNLILVPIEQILNKFEFIVNPILTILNKNILENENLTEIRNLLLPKLISGELHINDN